MHESCLHRYCEAPRRNRGYYARVVFRLAEGSLGHLTQLDLTRFSKLLTEKFGLRHRLTHRRGQQAKQVFAGERIRPGGVGDDILTLTAAHGEKGRVCPPEPAVPSRQRLAERCFRGTETVVHHLIQQVLLAVPDKRSRSNDSGWRP